MNVDYAPARAGGPSRLFGRLNSNPKRKQTHEPYPLHRSGCPQRLDRHFHRGFRFHRGAALGILGCTREHMQRFIKSLSRMVST